MKDKESQQKRITITCYDDEGYDLLTKYPLYLLIETAQETGMCVCRFEDDKMAYIEKTKAGYVIRAWKENGERTE